METLFRLLGLALLLGNPMYSKHHVLISTAIGVGLFVLLDTPGADPLIIPYAAVVGVAIDFDHFLIARFNSGTWRAAKAVLANPDRVFFDQASIFEPEEVLVLQRLLSHVIITGVVTVALYPLSDVLALVTAVVLYGHILSDLLADNYNRMYGDEPSP